MAELGIALAGPLIAMDRSVPVKFIVAVSCKSTPFTVAEMTTLSPTVFVTCPVALPWLFVGLAGCVIAALPVTCNTTFAPEIGLLYASYAVTVIVLGVRPSAGALAGLAVTCEV